MVDRVYLDGNERKIVLDILSRGLAVKPERNQWLGARIALARSLQIPDAPDPETFKKLAYSKGGSELHSPQLTGEGGDAREDFTDVYRALLSIYCGRDLFDPSQDEAFHDLLQAHVRRGLHDIESQWHPDRGFPDYLLRELFFDRMPDAVAATAIATDLRERVERILGQIGVTATVDEAREGPRITRFTLELATLEDFDRLRKGVSKIAFALGWGENAVTT